MQDAEGRHAFYNPYNVLKGTRTHRRNTSECLVHSNTSVVASIGGVSCARCGRGGRVSRSRSGQFQLPFGWWFQLRVWHRR